MKQWRGVIIILVADKPETVRKNDMERDLN